MLVSTGSYTGDGQDNRAVVVPFQPDVVIIYPSAVNAVGYYRFSTFDSTESKPFGNGAMETDAIKTFTPTGFTVGTNVAVNDSLTVYLWFAVKCEAADSAVFSYTGASGADDRSVGTLAFQPACAVVASDATTRWWWRTEELAGDLSQQHQSAAVANGIQALGATSIQVGTTLNTDTVVFHVWAFKEIPNVAMITEYAGDSIDGKTVAHTLGVQPVYALLHCQNVSRNIISRHSAHVGDLSTDIPNAGTQSEANLIAAWDATNVTLGDDVRVNTSVGSAVYTLVTFGLRTSGAPGKSGQAPGRGRGNPTPGQGGKGNGGAIPPPVGARWAFKSMRRRTR